MSRISPATEQHVVAACCYTVGPLDRLLLLLLITACRAMECAERDTGDKGSVSNFNPEKVTAASMHACMSSVSSHHVAMTWS